MTRQLTYGIFFFINIFHQGEQTMRQFLVSALVEGYRVEEYVMAASEHHAIRLLESKYSEAKNTYSILQG